MTSPVAAAALAAQGLTPLCAVYGRQTPRKPAKIFRADVGIRSDGTITVGENGIETAISLQDTARIRTVTLRNTSTGSQEHSVFDKTTGTVCSSITQDTAVLNDVDREEVAEPMTPYANQQGKTCTRYEFPYNEIKNACSAAPSAATLIGSLAGKIGIQFASGLVTVVAALGLAGVLLKTMKMAASTS